MIIQWKNRISGETGYVKCVDPARQCFENTFNVSEAKKFANKGMAAITIRKLIAYGEGRNNDFVIITA